MEIQRKPKDMRRDLNCGRKSLGLFFHLVIGMPNAEGEQSTGFNAYEGIELEAGKHRVKKPVKDANHKSSKQQVHHHPGQILHPPFEPGGRFDHLEVKPGKPTKNPPMRITHKAR